MESLDELTKTSSSKKGFFKHVFNFNEESKEEILNIIQYSILAIIPIVLLNKSIQRFIPEADDEKGNIEIVVEVVVQVIVMFLGIFFVDRLITYVPTYSGVKYHEFHVTTIILAVLAIVLSLQTKLGEKISILADRCMEMWEGKSEEGKKDKRGKKGKPAQVQSQPSVMNVSLNPVPMNPQSTSLSQLPPPQQTGGEYNTSYAADMNPLQSMNSTPSNLYEGFGPMAANEALGGGGFGGTNW